MNIRTRRQAVDLPEVCWVLVKYTSLSITDTAELCRVGTALVSLQRAALKALKERGEDPREMTWETARQLTKVRK